MRRILAAAVIMVSASTLASAGCLFSYTCVDDKTCPPPSGADGGDAGDAGDAHDGLAPNCDPAVDVVADDCGVFVSSGTGDDTNGKGTKEAPYKTLAHALSKGSIIYACAGAMPFSEALSISAPVTMFGALDCSSWAYAPANKTPLIAPADAIPLTLASSASGSAVHDFAITAADATIAGGSSIAVLDDGAELELTRCDLVAGKGADGVKGVKPTTGGQAGAAAPMPSPATALDGCTNQTGVFGGKPGNTKCGLVDTSGGSGGNGQNQTGGGAGTDALPQPQPNATAGHDGKAGKPQTTASPAAPCDNGNPGANGLPGTMPGTGATGIGDLTSSGYQPPLGTAGQTPGSPGYGGGGGGGAAQCTNTFAGPAGGGGGAGGCGGDPGGPGQSAGGSFGLISVGATISLDAVTIMTANGGIGGAGGDGQPGGHGGAGGTAGSANGDSVAMACPGGSGGQGGRGSSGGGGLGGHSVGIAFKGTAPTQMNVTIHHGMPGAGGIGGDMDMTSVGIVGAAGLACATLDFGNGSKTCTM
jgi:hypothetical protein